MQTASSSVQYSGVFDALSRCGSISSRCNTIIVTTPNYVVLLVPLSLYASGGLGALFVGSTARITWLVPFTTIYLGVYEASKRKLLELKKANT